MFFSVRQKMFDGAAKVISRLIILRRANATRIIQKSLAAFAVVVTVFIESEAVFAVQSSPELLNGAVVLGDGTTNECLGANVIPESRQDIGEGVTKLGASGNVVAPEMNTVHATNADESSKDGERPSGPVKPIRKLGNIIGHLLESLSLTVLWVCIYSPIWWFLIFPERGSRQAGKN